MVASVAARDDDRVAGGWGQEHGKTARGDVRHWQVPHVKVFRSNEQPGMTPVFGETCPPHGLSGLLREYAYQYGEGTNRHWMTLMFADRVDVFESFIADLFTGQIPREKGWSANAKYGGTDSRTAALMAGGALIAAVGVGILVTRALRD
jgi:hypothetical protein